MSGKGKKLLIVCEEPAARAALCAVFSGGYRLLEAAGCAEACAALRGGGTAAAVVDLCRRPQDGLALLRRMRADAALGAVPAVCVAAAGDRETQLAALRIGAADCFGASPDGALLRARVDNIVRGFSAARRRERARWREERARLSDIDARTGLWNKQAFCRETAKLLAAQPERRYVIARWDIDRFKVFNDTYGPQEGDRLLAAIGKEAQSVIRRYRGMLTQGHYDADHFVSCWLAEAVDPEWMCTATAQALSRAFPNYSFVVRFGFYCVEDPTLDVGLMCDRALLALRSVKDSWERHFAWYDAGMRTGILEEQEITSEMKRALTEGQFVPWYQPQYDYSTGALIGAEALARWEHPRRGVIPPGQFVPVFEKNGFIFEMDRAIWRQVCRQLRAWLDEGVPVPSVSVNVSRRDLYHPGLAGIFSQLAAEYRIDPAMLRLEITESAYMDNPEQLIRIVEELKGRGFSVEMDDFGSGYSSLNTLKDVPVDTLKMDLKFIAEDGGGSRGGSILSSVVRMAHAIDLPVIAEGVENRQQAEYLKSIGCTYMQGYLFAQPMPPAAFAACVRSGQVSRSLAQPSREGIGGAADFLSASTQATLLFNSFVGGAAILAYENGEAAALRINDRFFEVLGTTRAEYAGRQYHLLDRFEGNSRGIFTAALEEAIRTGREASCEVCSRPLRAGGDNIWLSCRVRWLAEKAGSELFYLAIENISSRILLSAHNDELNDRLSAITNSVPGGVIRLRIRGGEVNTEYVSEGFCRLLGYTPEELVGTHIADNNSLVHPADLAALVAAEQETILHGAAFHEQYRLRHKSGEWRWVDMRGDYVGRAAGDGLFYGCYVDITATKQLERRLERDRQEIQNLVNSIPGGVATYALHPDGPRLLYISEGAAALAGRVPADFPAGSGLGAEMGIFPADVVLVQSAIDRAVAAHEDAEVNFRLCHKNGETVWINMRGSLMGERDGLPVFYIVFHNISKRTELYRRALNESDNALIVADCHTRELLLVNDAAARLAGIPKERAAGMYCYEYLKHGSSPCSFCNVDKLGDEPLCTEYEQDGRCFFSRVTRIDWNGRDAFINYIADRTELRRAQQKLAALEAERQAR